MSLYEDPNWNREAKHVADKLDHGDVNGAQDSMRRDLFQLQNDPHAQNEFINMVSRDDRKGMGADINVFQGPDGREQWQISPPNYGDRYPAPLPPRPYPSEGYGQPSPGDALVNGLATGAGVGLGLGIVHNLFRRR